VNLLITGGAGFIGSNLVKNLLDNTDHKVVVIDKSVQNIARLENLTKNSRDYTIVNECYGNVGSEVIGQHQPDTIIHLAAVPRVAFSVEHPDTTTYENTYLLTKLLNKCKNSGVVKRFVFASSSSVYGGADVLPTPETHPLAPRSPYALQKKNGEEYCKMFSELYGMETVCLRFFNVFGPEQYVDSPYATVISNWCNSIKENIPLIIEDDGEQSRDFNYVDNVVEAIKCASFSDTEFNGDVFNVGNNEQTSLNQIVDWLHEKGYEFELDQRPARIGDVRHTKADITKIKSIGYEPVCDVWEGLDKTVNWWKIKQPAKDLS
jgi:nucleoside-diphosphate-sugar epimerase